MVDIFKSLSLHKAYGSDEISLKRLKHMVHYVVFPLVII